MTINLHKIVVTSAGKKSQPYILLGPLGHITSTWKVLKVRLCVCVYSGLRGYIYVTAFILLKTKDLEFVK